MESYCKTCHFVLFCLSWVRTGYRFYTYLCNECGDRIVFISVHALEIARGVDIEHSCPRTMRVSELTCERCLEKKERAGDP